MFIVCHGIRWVPNIWELFHTGVSVASIILYMYNCVLVQQDDMYLTWPPWVEYLTNISHLTTVINSSVNFYIYMAKQKGGSRRSSSRDNIELTPTTNGMVNDYFDKVEAELVLFQ